MSRQSIYPDAVANDYKSDSAPLIHATYRACQKIAGEEINDAAYTLNLSACGLHLNDATQWGFALQQANWLVNGNDHPNYNTGANKFSNGQRALIQVTCPVCRFCLDKAMEGNNVSKLYCRDVLEGK